MSVSLISAWLVSALLVVLVSSTDVLAQTPPRLSRPSADATAAAKTFHRKIQGPLRAILRDPFGAPAIAGPAQLSLNLVDADGRTAVRIRTDAPATIVALLESIGRSAANVSAGSIETYLSPPQLLLVESAPEVINVRAIETMTERVVTQGRIVHNAANWHSGGLTGTNVRIGIIDSFGGVQSKLGTELPSSVVARCYTSVGAFSSSLADCDQGSVHGTAVAETIFDMAPGAQLYIANPVSRGDFRQTVNWMVANNVKVINFSAVYTWDGPGNGTSLEDDSPLRGVDDAVAGGALFVSAAGNEGRATWLGPWQDLDSDNIGQFTPSSTSETNGVSLSAGQRITVQLRWSDSWAAATTDIDLWLYDSSLGTPVESSTLPQDGTAGDTPFEILTYVAPSSGTYYIVLTRYSGAAPSWAQVQTFTSQTLQYSTAGSIGNPAESANPGMLTAGAAWWNTPSTIETFSSQGPTPDGRVKPDIVGADGGDTASYGPGAFFGTSQATPHVVGLAALVKEAFPSYTPSQLASYLKNMALPRGSRPNNTWGYGFAHLPSVCDFSLDPSSATAAPAGGQLTVQVTATAQCSWTATESASWLSIASGASGAGTATVTITVASNHAAARSASVTIAGLTFWIAQQALSPPPPTGLTASVNGNLVTMNWLAPAGVSVTAYGLQAGTSSGSSNLASVQLGSARTLTVSAPNGTYYIRVLALTAAGWSAPSNEVVITVDVGPPGTPLDLQSIVLGSLASFSWQRGPGGTPTSYLLEAGSAPGLANLAIVPVTATSLAVSGVPPGTYFVRMRAVNSAGTSAPSNEVTVVVAVQPPPGPPANLMGSAVGSNVTLQWQAPTSGGTPTGYTLIAGSAPGLADVIVLPLGSAMGISATNVPAGTYHVRVIATNAAGQSAPSNEVVLVVSQ